MEALEARALGEELHDVAGAHHVDLEAQRARHRQVVHGGQMVGGPHRRLQLPGVLGRQAEAGGGDVARHHARPSARAGMRGFHRGQPLPRGLEEPALDEAPEARLGSELQEARQEPHADEAREPREQDGGGRGAVGHGRPV